MSIKVFASAARYALEGRTPEEQRYLAHKRLMEAARDFAFANHIVDPKYISAVTVWEDSIQLHKGYATADLAIRPIPLTPGDA